MNYFSILIVFFIVNSKAYAFIEVQCSVTCVQQQTTAIMSETVEITHNIGGLGNTGGERGSNGCGKSTTQIRALVGIVETAAWVPYCDDGDAHRRCANDRCPNALTFMSRKCAEHFGGRVPAVERLICHTRTKPEPPPRVTLPGGHRR